MNVKIKICRVNDVNTAKKLEQLGVDYIGIHILRELTPEKEELYKSLDRELTKTLPVIVTKIKDVRLLNIMVARLKPKFIQLHSDQEWNREEIVQLRETIIYSGNLCPKFLGVIGLETLSDIKLIDELANVCDYLLFDRSRRGGTGILIDEKILQEAVKKVRPYGKPFFIAGGLNPENVKRYIVTYRPYGVDVQSGVEIEGMPGCKNFDKVKRLVKECRSIK